MRTRSKAVISLLIGMALLALSAAPASANTVNIDLTDGYINVIDWTDGTTVLQTFPLGGTTTNPCTTTTLNSTAVAAGTTSGTFSVFIVSRTIVVIGSTAYIVTLYASLHGTYSSSGAVLNVATDPSPTITNTALATVWLLGDTPCTPADPGDPICTIVATGFTGSGAATPGSMPNMTSGDTASVTMANGAFETVANDLATPGCGPFSVLNNNILTVTATITVT